MKLMYSYEKKSYLDALTIIRNKDPKYRSPDDIADMRK